MAYNNTKQPMYDSILKIHTKYNGVLIVNVSESPQISTVKSFSYQMKKKGVTDIFCFCNLTYDPYSFRLDKISFHHLPFDDGTAPPPNILAQFDSILNTIMVNKKSTDETSINLHCMSGLGRAPAIMAYVLLKYEKIDRNDAIEKIRKIRKGALNHTQLEWVETCKIIKDDTNCRCVIA